MNADQIGRTIEPGSLPQGQRQEVVSNLQTALGSSGGSPASQGAVPAGGAAVPSQAPDPLQRLLSGSSSSDLPVSDGLSKGPGNGPLRPGNNYAGSPKVQKLRLLASQASSPMLRQMARDALRAEVRKERQQSG